MEYFLKNNLLALLTSLAISDEPPGMKSCVLRFISKILIQLREPNVAHSALYVPLMVILFDGNFHTHRILLGHDFLNIIVAETDECL